MEGDEEYAGCRAPGRFAFARACGLGILMAFTAGLVRAQDDTPGTLVPSAPRITLRSPVIVTPTESSADDVAASQASDAEAAVKSEASPQETAVGLELLPESNPEAAKALQAGTDRAEIEAGQAGKGVGALDVARKVDSKDSIDAILARRGSVSFRDSPLSEVIFSISSVWGINIVAGQNVSGSVSGKFEDVPLAEVLEAVLSANDYAYKQTGTTLIVLPANQIGQEDATFVTRVLSVGFAVANPDALLETLETMLGPRGTLRWLEANRALLVVDTPARVERVEGLLRQLVEAPPSEAARPGRVREAIGDAALPPPSLTDAEEVAGAGVVYFTPQFTDAEQMSETLRDALDEDVIVSLFAEENRIIVRGDAEDLQMASQMVAQLDRPRPQVRISALIYDVGLEEIANLGIDWSGGSDNGTVTSSGGSGLLPTATDDAALEGVNLALTLVRDHFNLGATLNALNSCEGAELLADPTVTVRDRTEASMRIVQRIPVTTIGQLGDSAATFQQIEFEDAGIILTVNPRISRDGTIEMDINTEFSVLTGNLNGQPIIDTRTADTQVRVVNGQSFVLGGLRQKSVNEIVRGVPYLKDLKHFGKYFRSHETEVVESELIVFIKPEIVGPYDNATPREQTARCISHLQLDRIAVADCRPFLPDCGDPHCPYHRPRARVNGGGSGQLLLIGGSGIEALPQVYGGAMAPPAPESLGGTPPESGYLPPNRERRIGAGADQPVFQSARERSLQRSRR